MSQVQVVGISDLRGRKSKDGTKTLNFAIFHCLVPLGNYEGNIGYNVTDVFINESVLKDTQLVAPANYDIVQAFNSKDVVSIKYLGQTGK